MNTTTKHTEVTNDRTIDNVFTWIFVSINDL
jgi:hypothetical protein